MSSGRSGLVPTCLAPDCAAAPAIAPSRSCARAVMSKQVAAFRRASTAVCTGASAS
jgi:hypothetical protein